MNIYWMQKLCEDSHITQYESCIMGIIKVTSQKQLTFLPLFSYIFVFFKKIEERIDSKHKNNNVSE